VNRHRALLLRAHAALMPDYSRRATALWCLLLVLGGAALLHSAARVVQWPAGAAAQTAAGIAIAMVAGMFPVLIPRTSFAIGAAEIFVFLMLAMLGPEAAVLAAAGEAAVASWNSSRRWTSRLASPAIAAAAMLLCGSAYAAVMQAARGASLPAGGTLVAALIGASLLYYACTSVLLSMLVRLKDRQPLQLLAMLAGMRWVGIAYAASASIAALLYLSSREFGSPVLIAAVPVIAMFLLTLSHFFERQDALDQAHEARVQAAERDALAAARHSEALARSETRFQRAFDNAPNGMALLSEDGRLVQTNQALRSLLGLSEAAHPALSFAALAETAGAAEFDAELGRLVAGEIETFSIELACRSLAGDELQLALHGSRLSASDGEARHVILQVQDVTARLVAERRLNHLAYHDSLTGLPNRSQFLERLQQAVARHARDPARRYAVMFFDFDRFKLINDSLGHAAGDEFLVQASQRIRANIRPRDTVARLGGDEFAVLSEDAADSAEMVRLASRLQAQLQRPFLIGTQQIASSASIGITHSDGGRRSADEVLRDADTAMYRAKAAGKACHVVFDASQHGDVSDRMALEADLRAALASGELDVVFQPMVEMAGRSVIGFEALARWRHPVRGVVDPTRFIALAEETGLLPSITDFVLERACRMLRDCQALGPRFERLRMHVNIGARDIDDATLSLRMLGAIERAGLRPEHLTLELTENILMDRLTSALPGLQALRERGVGLGIDDFGIGHSSLGHLCSLPIDCMKIDATFVRNLHAGSSQAETIRAIVTLGKALRKTVVAEGIETDSQYDLLRELGCPIGQGFLMSRPLETADVAALLTAPPRPRRASAHPADRRDTVW
jgi:diguanylate cyclase (GGDEF)-like protein/PAS domain S-box-containing protein